MVLATHTACLLQHLTLCFLIRILGLLEIQQQIILTL